jgi:hypothetical protein
VLHRLDIWPSAYEIEHKIRGTHFPIVLLKSYCANSSSGAGKHSQEMPEKEISQLHRCHFLAENFLSNFFRAAFL